MSVPSLIVRGRPVPLGSRPVLMGIVNATPDSFSDAGLYPTLEARVERARELLRAGAGIIDIGGQSGVTNAPEIAAEEEIGRVVPLIQRVVGELRALVSVDTYKPAVAEAAIAAGAAIVNDTSGLRDPELAEVCARTGAGLVLMHNRSAPKQRLTDPHLYEDVIEDVLGFLEDKLAVARSAGVPWEATLVDPGPDFAKTPAQTIDVLRQLDRVHALGRPVLLALSRKDFIGALTGRPPRARLAGTLAAIGYAAHWRGQILRLHDIAEAVDYLAVHEALTGLRDVPADLELASELRREAPEEGC
jgi:dihydropteroate synthase